MKIFFENWLEEKENNFSSSVKEIFADAIRCYKNGIYKPALMLSYIAFMNVLKERIMLAEKPESFPLSEWKRLRENDLVSENMENIVFTATQNKKNIIFCISDDLRKQIEYWKYRRNDCAHYKENIIDSYHVEAFWAFLKSNLPKITIEGGMQSLLNKLKKHYDISYTPVDKDVTYLVKEIENAVLNTELNDFWKYCIDFFGSKEFCYINISDEIFNFFEKIMSKTNENIQKSLLLYLTTNDDYKIVLRKYLSKFPNRIIDCNFDDSQIRNFWQEHLYYCDNFLDIYATMLSKELIPQNEINEANDRLLLIVSSKNKYEISSELNYILIKNGFTKAFENKYFNNNFFSSNFANVKKVNEKASLFFDYLLKNDFNKNIVEVLCFSFEQEKYSYSFDNKLFYLFREYQDKKNDFLQIATEHSISIPQKLQNYCKQP